MPSKPVVQNTCERCTRVWYTEKAAEVKLELNAELAGAKFNVKYGCLCAGCENTVTSLLKSIAKEFKPRAPRAKKKDESADQGKPQSTDSTTTPDASPAGAPASASGASAASLAASSSGAAVPPASPANASHGSSRPQHSSPPPPAKR